MNQRDIERASFREVPETCPHVEEAMAVATEAIKEQTGKLRDALNEYIGKCGDLEEELEEAHETIKALQEELDDLRSESA